MGKSTISMAIFNSYVKLPEGILWLYYDYVIIIRANTPFRPHSSYLGKINKGIREYKGPTPVKCDIHFIVHSLKIFNKGSILPPPLNLYIH